MAHKFESGLFFGESAWHGLGTTLPSDSAVRHSIPDAMRIAKLDWEVESVPMYVAAGDQMPEVKNFKAIQRKDSGKVLGVVTDRYRVLQNADQFKWFEPFLESGEASFETCGSLKGGNIVWVLARINREDLEIAKGDMVRKYLLLTSSHDGSMATRVGFAPIRVVCWNTLSAAVSSEASKLLKIKHTERQHAALKEVRACINLVNQTFEATAVQYRKLAAHGLKLSELRKYVKLVLDVPEDESAVSTRTKNMVEGIVNLCTNGAGQSPDNINAWGAYNGITQYITHHAGNEAETRLRSAWYGPGQKLSAKALELALALVA